MIKAKKNMMSDKRTRIFPINDAHVGLKVGLMPEHFIEDEGTSYERVVHAEDSRSQKWLFERFAEVCDAVFDGTADEVVVLLMGDEIHGNSEKSSSEIWTSSLSSQAMAYIQLVLPAVNKASKTYYIKGTSWHMGVDGTVEAAIARELGVYKKTPFHKMEVTIDGIRFSLQHKGPKPGTRAWTRDNAMFYMLKDISFRSMQRGDEPADVYLWAHFHEDLGMSYKAAGPWGEKTIVGQVLPAWCMPAEYALSNVKNLEYADVGSVFYDIQNGIVTERKMITKKDVVERVAHK